MNWFETLYDDFRQRTGFGSIPRERTALDANFIQQELGLQSGSRILDLCSGTGRHAIELAQRGIEVVGVELNEEYVALAKERAEQAGVAPTFVQGDVRTVAFGTEYDGAILMWNSFGYFDDDEDRALIGKLGAALKLRGRFLIELLNRDYLLCHFEPRAESNIDGIRVVEERELDLLSSRAITKITRHESDDIVTRETRWRLYSPHEIREIGEAAGLMLVGAYGSLERDPLARDTRLMRLVFERRDAER